MSRQFTIQDVATHNQNNFNTPDKWWAIIHGEVYQVASIPLAKCKTRSSFYT